MGSPNYRCSVLLVDDMPAILGVLTRQLELEFDTRTATNCEDAKRQFETHSFDVVVTDLQLPDASGIELLDWVRTRSGSTVRILLTGKACIEDAVEAVNRTQIHRFLLKPWLPQDLIQHIREASQNRQLEHSHRHLLNEYRSLNQQLEQRVLERTQELRQALTQLEQKNQFLERMALTDALTGLPNRRAVELIARKELLRRSRTPSTVTIGIIDIDFFKDINSAHTLDGGDHVIRWVGQMLLSTVRASDSVGRSGGEEYLIVAPETDSAGANVLAERLRRTIEQNETVYQGRKIPLTVSGGFATANPQVMVSFEDLYKHAARALKTAKDNGRNQTVVRYVSPEPVATSS